jgi:hypothetical protein
MVRWRLWPRAGSIGLAAAALSGLIGIWALASGAVPAAVAILIVSIVIVVRVMIDAAAALAVARAAARP